MCVCVIALNIESSRDSDLVAVEYDPGTCSLQRSYW